MYCTQRWAKGRLSTFDLYPGGGGGHGVLGQICHILTPASYESLPAPSGHRFPHFGNIHLGGGGSDIRSMSSIRPICKCRCPTLYRLPCLGAAQLRAPGKPKCCNCWYVTKCTQNTDISEIIQWRQGLAIQVQYDSSLGRTYGSKIENLEQGKRLVYLPPPSPPNVHHVGNILLAGRKVNVRLGYFNIYSNGVGPRLCVLFCPPVSQSIYIPKSTTVSVPSSESEPYPLSRIRVCPPPGGDTLVCGWGTRGGPNSDDWRKSLALCLHCNLFTQPV